MLPCRPDYLFTRCRGAGRFAPLGATPLTGIVVEPSAEAAWLLIVPLGSSQQFTQCFDRNYSLKALMQKLIGKLGFSAGLVDLVGGAADDERVRQDLRIIAQPDGRRHRIEGGDVVTFNMGICAGGAQCIGLPFLDRLPMLSHGIGLYHHPLTGRPTY